MPTERDDIAGHPPPWIVFPDLQPSEPANQGAVEAYVALEWLPFWTALSNADQIVYLDRWQASPRWREVIAGLYGPSEIDYATEAAEAAEAECDRAAKKSKWRLRVFHR